MANHKDEGLYEEIREAVRTVMQKAESDCLGECDGSCVTRDIQRSYE